MTKTELLEAIIQKQDELIKKYAEYSRFLLRHGISNCGAWIIMKDQLDNDLNEMLFELSELKKQLEECKEDVNFTKDDIDLAYCAGIWNTGGIDVLRKELERLKHIGRKPHQIFQRYKPIKTE